MKGNVMGVELGLGVAVGCGVMVGTDAKAVAMLSSAIRLMALSEVVQPKSAKSAPKANTAVTVLLTGTSLV